jgi:tetratricopeptide (TPR) repeat protein
MNKMYKLFGFKQTELIMYKWKNPDPAITLATFEELEFYRLIGQYDTVVEICQGVVQYSPNDFLAQYHLAVAYNDIDKHEESIETFNIVLKLPRTEEYVVHEILFYQSNSYYEIKNYEKSIEFAKQALSHEIDENIDDETLAEYYEQLCDSYVGLENHKEALKAIDKALNYNTDVAEYYNKKGNILRELDMDEESLVWYNKAIDMDPDPVYYSNRGNTHSELLRYNEALDDFENAAALDPCSEYNCSKGRILYKLDRYEESLLALDISTEKDPANASAYCFKGDTLNKLNRDVESFEAFDKAIELNPKKSTHYNNKGFCLNQQERYQEAIEMFHKAMECAPKIANSYCHKGYALYKLGDPEAAMEWYTKALELRPEYDLALERVAELNKPSL